MIINNTVFKADKLGKPFCILKQCLRLLRLVRMTRCWRAIFWWKFMKLDGFGVFVKDMPTMVRFYRDILGFEIKEVEDASNVFLKKDGTLFLFYRSSYFEKMISTRFNYAEKINGHFGIALGVENSVAVDKAYSEIVAKGGESIMPLTTEPWGQRTCYIADIPKGIL